ncbi:hypothetical protein FACS1894168_1090 [Deltaproteobacteria bacterium]|nr:hypothetical protein FACS1894168_1090 [Deltaproteobacteria bacterium]
MLFKRPDALLWEYVSPMCEGFAIKGSAGVRWRDNRKNTKPFSVSTDIVGAIIASQLIIWVSLDFERIEKEYALTVFESSPPILLLTPKRKDVAEVIKNLVIAFTVEGVASSVTITEQQGGVTVIRFTNVRVNGLIPDEEFQ